MKSETRKGWTKQDGEDAARLLAEMVQRAKKASGGFERPEQIQNPADVPRAGERGAGRFEGLQRPAPVIANAGGVSVGGTVLAANSNGQIFRGKFQSEANQTARLTRDALVDRVDRARKTRSRVEW